MAERGTEDGRGEETGRGTQDGTGEAPDRDSSPVDHHPPEEWRPGDAGDPITGGAQPAGEPPHRFPRHDWPADRHPPEERQPDNAEDPTPPATPADGPETPTDSSVPPTFAAPPEGLDTGGQNPLGSPRGHAPFGRPSGSHPTGARPGPAHGNGEPSEGPSGLDQAGYEHAGYAPGHGESDNPGTGAGTFPAMGPPPEPGAPAPGTLPQEAHRTRSYPPGGYPPGTFASGGHGYPPGGGYARPGPASTPWGKILGAGCGIALLLMLVAGGCMALAMLTVSETSTAPDPRPSDPPQAEGTRLSAATTDFVPSPLHTGGEYTSVDVSVTNDSEERIDVNPLYFTLVDDEGVNHSSRTGVGMDANEIGTKALAPGQATGGAVTVEGDLVPERVIFAPLGHNPLEVPID